ncbi:MAG: hypothetical protein Tsb0010_02520 [Parvularculaceae bacterium]
MNPANGIVGRFSNWRLHALIPAPWAEAVDARLRAERLGVGALIFGDVAAVIGPETPLWSLRGAIAGHTRPATPFSSLPRQRRVLEVIIGVAPCVAVAENAPAMRKQELIRLLKQYSASLSRAVQEYGSFVQFDVIAHWDLNDVIESLEREGRAPRRLKLPEGPLGEAYANDAEARMKKLIAEKKLEAGARLGELIRPVAHEMAPLTLSGANVIAGAATIVRRSRISELYRALEDARAMDSIEISCIGPMPARALVAIEIIDTRAAQVAKARRVLSTPAQTTRGDIKGAYYDAMKENHPDFRRNGRVNTAAITAIQSAYEILTAYAEQQGAKQSEDVVSFVKIRSQAPYTLRLRKYTPSNLSLDPIAA